MIKKYKGYIIVIGVLVVYFVFAFIFASRSKKMDSQYISIVIDGVSGWEYKNREWNTINDFTRIDETIKYKIYSYNNYYGDYTIKVTNNYLYGFDSDYNSLQYNGSILAYNSNIDVNVLSFDYLSADSGDIFILKDILDKYSIYNTSIKKVIIDLNNDNNDEYIYILNIYNDNNDSIFSGIYLYDNELKEIIKSNNSYSSVYNVAYILDLDKDNIFEIVISSNFYDNFSYSIYNFEDDNYTLFLM